MKIERGSKLHLDARSYWTNYLRGLREQFELIYDRDPNLAVRMAETARDWTTQISQMVRDAEQTAIKKVVRRRLKLS